MLAYSEVQTVTKDIPKRNRRILNFTALTCFFSFNFCQGQFGGSERHLSLDRSCWTCCLRDMFRPGRNVANEKWGGRCKIPSGGRGMCVVAVAMNESRL